MTTVDYAKKQATAIRYGERVRWEERCRAFDIIEMLVDEKEEAVAVALYTAAAQIMQSKQ